MAVLFHYHSMGPWRSQMAPDGSILRLSPHPHHHIEPSPISIKRFDRSYNPLNHFLPLWSEPETAGWKGWTPMGSAVSSHRYYIMFISKEVGDRGSICASVLQDDFDLDYLLPRRISRGHVRVKHPEGRIWVKAITSHRLKLLKLLRQGPAMLWAALWPAPQGSERKK